MEMISKATGLQILQLMGVKTVECSYNTMPSFQKFTRENSWSLRLSRESVVCERLDSWHNIKNYTYLFKLNELSLNRGFSTIIHPMVNPKYIGHLLRVNLNGFGYIAIEFFDTFENRNKGVFFASYYVPITGDRFIFHMSKKENLCNSLITICSYLLGLSNSMKTSKSIFEFVYEEELIVTDFHSVF